MRILVGVLVWCALGCGLATAQMVPWLERGGNGVHAGWNSQETVLTQASVTAKGVSLAPPIPVPFVPGVIGDLRGAEAEPLVSPPVVMKKDGTTHSLVLVASMADVVGAYDATTNVQLWQRVLATPVNGNATIDIYGINDHWGCESTGVVDPATLRWYQICEASPDGSGSPATSRFSMYVLDLRDGSLVVPPVMLAGPATVNGHGTPQEFNSQMRKMRASAVMLPYGGHTVVIQCGGSVYMTHPGVGGFCFSFDTKSNTFTSEIATSQGRAANVWMSGGAPAVMPDGSIFFVTATGGFDGTTQFGESLVKMTYDGKLRFADHWTPYSDRNRTGQDPMTNLTAGANPSTGNYGRQEVPVSGHAMAMPNFKGAKIVSNINAQGQVVPLVYPPIAAGTWADEDLGSAQQTCIAEIKVCLVMGKDGIAYAVKTDKLGNTTMADLANPKANCAKLAAAPVFVTVDPGPVDPCPVNSETLNFMPWGATAHVHFAPVQMYDPVLKSWVFFVGGENQQLHKWAVSATGKLTYVAQSLEFASADVRSQPGGGMTGMGCGGSSNGDLEHGGDPNSALLVCTLPYGDANKTVTGGRMLVLDPIHTSDGIIHTLWDSQRWGVPFMFNKFGPPFIDGGTIWYADYAGRVMVLR